MAITRNLSHLDEGCVPDAEPRFAQLLVLKWERENEEERASHVSSGKKFRASDAGKCARYLGYRAAGIEPTSPMDLSGHWNTSIGKLIHDQWQQALAEAYPDAEVEVAIDFAPDGTVRIDAVIRTAAPALEGGQTVAPRVIVYELKTIGGYGFKAAIGKIRQGTPAEGPKPEHVLQAALGGKARDADEIVVGYLAKECLSVNVAKGMPELARFVAEWTYTREEYEPLAEQELARVTGIVGLLDGGELPARKIPDVPGEIVDPSRGRWEWRDVDGTLIDTGSYWGCAYCSQQPLCSRTDAGRIPVEQAVKIRATLP